MTDLLILLPLLINVPGNSIWLRAFVSNLINRSYSFRSRNTHSIVSTDDRKSKIRQHCCGRREKKVVVIVEMVVLHVLLLESAQKILMCFVFMACMVVQGMNKNK